MAKITILKHKRKEDLQKDFLAWVRNNELVKKYNVPHEDIPELFQILLQFSGEIEMVKSIQESSYFITNSGLPDTALKIIEDFIKEDSHYVVVDNIEVFKDDHMLVILDD